MPGKHGATIFSGHRVASHSHRKKKTPAPFEAGALEFVTNFCRTISALALALVPVQALVPAELELGLELHRPVR